MDSIEKQPKQKESSKKYVDGSLQILNQTLETQSEKVSGVVNENTSDNTGNSSTQKKEELHNFGTFFSGFSTQISKLLFKGNSIKSIPKSRKQQEQHIAKALRKEQKRLQKKAKKIINSRSFSASKLEKTILQIRQIQKLIQNLMDMAVDQIKELYQKYVLKK